MLLYLGGVQIHTSQKQNGYLYLPNGFVATEYNYNTAISHLARRYNFSPYYLKALIVLETSGRTENLSRFEPAIFTKLKALQATDLEQFENLTTVQVQGLSNAQLQLMATSWGPFQIMGYKHVFLEISLDELRGENALEHGVEWIDRTYGSKLRAKQFKDAFHIHNTGQAFPENGTPTTHDPNYVQNGLKYMKLFENAEKKALPWKIVMLSSASAK